MIANGNHVLEKEFTSIARAITFIGLLLIVVPCAQATVNVYFTGPQSTTLQQNFLLDTTNQYQTTLTANPFFANTYSVSISAKNPIINPPPPPSQCNTDLELAIATTTLSGLTVQLGQLATDYYLNGWANGMETERMQDLATIGFYEAPCSSSAFTALPGYSTSTWVVPKIDSTTCHFALGYVKALIDLQSYTTPQTPPGF